MSGGDLGSGAPVGAEIGELLGEPHRVGSERRSRVRLVDGRVGVLGQLLPELARDESLRRRYLRDVERLWSMGAPGICPILAWGPRESEAPMESAEVAPWRLRLDPEGETLDDWLDRRAPAPVDEMADLGARLAEILHGIHERGGVVRDVHPRLIVLAEKGPLLTDVGLARVDILSTRTAASLILEGSPYASPEQLRHTSVDQRSDLFGLGVILWRGLTGTLPFGEGPAPLSGSTKPPRLLSLRADVPAPLSALLSRLLAFEPEERPPSARDVAEVLRGEKSLGELSERTTCQGCGATLLLGQRICLACGKEAVRFRHAEPDTEQTYTLSLRKAVEEASFHRSLREFLSTVSSDDVPPLDFIVGHEGMYSKDEKQRRHRLPLRLFNDLDYSTALALKERMSDAGLSASVRRTASPERRRRWIMGSLVGVGALLGYGAYAGGAVLAFGVGIAVATVAGIAGAAVLIRRNRIKPPLLHLREAPAALPASDPLVGRLAALLDEHTPADVRQRVGELALLLERLVNHRARLEAGRSQDVVREAANLAEPLAPLVGLIEKQVAALRAIDPELGALDEGVLVRGLAASEARKAPAAEREHLLASLDRLRDLEEARAAALHRLLDAASLMRRTVEIGLEVQDPEAAYNREVQLAMDKLTDSLESEEQGAGG